MATPVAATAGAGAAGVLSFKNIGYVGKAGVGTFKLTAQQLGWQGNSTSDSQVVLTGRELAFAEWQRSCGRDRCLLRLGFKSGLGGVHRLTGFRSADLASLKAHLQSNFAVGLVDTAVATEGWSWGELDFSPPKGEAVNVRDVRFTVGGRLGFDLPVSDLRLVSTVKTDVNLEFEEPVIAPGEEVLTEMCLSIPPSGTEQFTAAFVRDELQKRAGLAASGSVLARFTDVQIVAPRGKHDLEFFAQSLKVRGKSQSYVIQYKSVERMFLLELDKSKQWALVVGLSNPLRQGKQLHHFVVITFDDGSLVIDLPPDLLKVVNRKEGEIVKSYYIISQLFKHFSGKTPAGPSSDFRELHPDKEASVRCCHKAQPGQLFFCKQSFLFVTKPVLWCRYDDLEACTIVTVHLRGTFDLVFIRKNGFQYEFEQIDTSMLESLLAFLKKANVQINDLASLELKVQTKQRRSHGMVVSPHLPGADVGKSGVASSSREAAGSKSAANAKGSDDGSDDPEDEDFESGSEDDEAGSDEDSEEQDEPKTKRAKRGAKG